MILDLDHDQVTALRDLMREHDAHQVLLTPLGPYGTVTADLYRIDEPAPVHRALITPAGTIRDQPTVAIP